MSNILAKIVAPIAYVGTARGLFDVLSACCRRKFVTSRGAVIPALNADLDQAETQRAYQALLTGCWSPTELVASVAQVLKQETPTLQAVKVGRYALQVLDLTAFFRPKLQDCPTKHYHPVAQRAVPALPLGLLGEVHQTPAGKHVALLTAVVAPAPAAPTHAAHRTALLATVVAQHQPDTVTVGDREFTPSVCLAAGVRQMVGRLRHNATFARGAVPEYGGRGRRPTRRPELVRPLPGKHRGTVLPATPPDATTTWTGPDGHTLRADRWDKLYLRAGDTRLPPRTDAPARQAALNCPLQVVAVYHPDYRQPWLLYTDCMDLAPQQIYDAYRARWSIELVPQTAKTLLGLGREFVHAPSSCARLPVLALLSAVIMNVVAATTQPIATGFWDRRPAPTPGRLARYLSKVGIPVPPELSKKNSVTKHLPVGAAARGAKPAPTAVCPALAGVT